MPTNANPQQIIQEVADFVWRYVSPDEIDYYDFILRRDVLLYGWWLQEKSGDQVINFNRLLNLACVNQEFPLRSHLNLFSPFIEGNTRKDFKFKPDLLQALTSNRQLFFGAKSFYRINEPLPHASLNTLQVLESIHQLRQHDGNLTQLVAEEVLKKMLHKIEVKPLSSDKRFYIISNSGIHHWEFILMVYDNWETIHRAEVYFELNQQVQNYLTAHHCRMLWVFPSIDGEAAKAINNTRNQYAFDSLNFIGFLHLLNDLCEQDEYREKASLKLMEIFQDVENSSRYSAGFAMNALKRALGLD